jgi:hypothetical protein
MQVSAVPRKTLTVPDTGIERVQISGVVVAAPEVRVLSLSVMCCSPARRYMWNTDTMQVSAVPRKNLTVPDTGIERVQISGVVVAAPRCLSFS